MRTASNRPPHPEQPSEEYRTFFGIPIHRAGLRRAAARKAVSTGNGRNEGRERQEEFRQLLEISRANETLTSTRHGTSLSSTQDKGPALQPAGADVRLGRPPLALAEDVELDAPELACLKCHDKDGLKMKTQKGEVLPLSISTKAFVALHAQQDQLRRLP
jgi:hypothetical protein